MTELDIDLLQRDGFYLLSSAVDPESVNQLLEACEAVFRNDTDENRARSSRGHVYAARNLLDAIPMLKSFWQTGVLSRVVRDVLGEQAGLVRVLYFDKPPDRTWTLPWHKDLAIAVKEHVDMLRACSRPTVKAGVPHVVATDEVLQKMLTLRVHLDQVTDENGPLQVVAGSHLSSHCEGVGVEQAATVYAEVGDVLAMRPLISHCSGASQSGTQRHRRILHLEFASGSELPDGLQWHDFVQLKQDATTKDTC